MSSSPPVIVNPNPRCERLVGKRAIVTAGTLGIGKACAARLAQEGASVLICSRKQRNVDDAVAELTGMGLDVYGHVCNVGKRDQLESLVAKAVQMWGAIDIIVSNAGANPYVGLALDAEDWVFEKIFRINVHSYLMLVQIARPHLRKDASIVFVASTGAYMPTPPLGIYAVSKTAVVSLAKLLAVELGNDGIRVNAIAPGVVRTRMAKMLWESEDSATAIKNGLMLGRLADPVDMAGTVSFLCSDDSRHLTGESIVVSGGTFSHL